MENKHLNAPLNLPNIPIQPNVNLPAAMPQPYVAPAMAVQPYPTCPPLYDYGCCPPAYDPCCHPIPDPCCIPVNPCCMPINPCCMPVNPCCFPY